MVDPQSSKPHLRRINLILSATDEQRASSRHWAAAKLLLQPWYKWATLVINKCASGWRMLSLPTVEDGRYITGVANDPVMTCRSILILS
jgi:hypothetical protein